MQYIDFEFLSLARYPTSPQRATFMENEYGWFMRVYGMSFVSSEILKPEPRKHKKIKALDKCYVFLTQKTGCMLYSMNSQGKTQINYLVKRITKHSG